MVRPRQLQKQIQDIKIRKLAFIRSLQDYFKDFTRCRRIRCIQLYMQKEFLVRSVRTSFGDLASLATTILKDFMRCRRFSNIHADGASLAIKKNPLCSSNLQQMDQILTVSFLFFPSVSCIKQSPHHNCLIIIINSFSCISQSPHH